MKLIRSNKNTVIFQENKFLKQGICPDSEGWNGRKKKQGVGTGNQRRAVLRAPAQTPFPQNTPFACALISEVLPGNAHGTQSVLKSFQKSDTTVQDIVPGGTEISGVPRISNLAGTICIIHQ